MRPRVLMADDHSIVLAGLRKLVGEECDVVGTVEDGRALIEAARKLRPDVILLDVAMPLLNGLDAARQLVKLTPQSKLIFLTMQSSPTYAAEAFKAGASGYLLKRSAPAELLQAIRAVLKGQHYITPILTRDLLQSALHPSAGPMLKPRLASLTPRQREVLQLLAEGKTAKEMASLLNVSARTVEFHKARIMQILDIHTTAELTQFAVAEGLLSP